MSPALPCLQVQVAQRLGGCRHDPEHFRPRITRYQIYSDWNSNGPSTINFSGLSLSGFTFSLVNLKNSLQNNVPKKLTTQGNASGLNQSKARHRAWLHVGCLSAFPPAAHLKEPQNAKNLSPWHQSPFAVSEALAAWQSDVCAGFHQPRWHTGRSWYLHLTRVTGHGSVPGY